MPRLSRLLILTAILFLLPSASAQTPSPAKKKPWTAADLVLTDSASQFQISPDARSAVWVKSTPDKEKDTRFTNLFLSSLIEKKEIPLTRGPALNFSPRWSPNGELIAFLSSRPRAAPPAPADKKDDEADAPGKPAPIQLWLINPAGGEPWPITEFLRGIRRFEWLDNDTILFSAEEDPSLYEQQITKKKDDTRVVEDAPHTPPVRLFRLSLAAKKVTRLTTNDDWIDTWDVSPNSRFVVASHDQSLSYQWDQRIPPVTFLHDLSTGAAKKIFTTAKLIPARFRWARDNSGFYAALPKTSSERFVQAYIYILYFYDLAASAESPVNLAWDRGLTSPFAFEPTPDGFLALLADGARDKPARYTLSTSPDAARTWNFAPLEGTHASNIFSFSISEDARTLIYQYSTASTPAQWFTARLNASTIAPPLQLTDLNPHFKQRTIARTEIIRWPGANGAEVEGILYYPHNYEPGKRFPLITAPHGGPLGADFDFFGDDWAYAYNLHAQAGAFVLLPNYHGSSNYGLAFAESICCGKYYDLPLKDIEAGVDHLIQKGLADPERIAAMGWSNGSILSIALSVANPARYKALSAGAGDVEWISDWANVDFGHAFDTYYLGASPLENPQLYIQLSPFFQMDKVRAPTIIFFGNEDRNVPTSQGWSHFRALQHLGKVPVRFLLFPGAQHGLRKLTHQTRKITEEMDWFNRYFYNAAAPLNEAFKLDSPLGEALRAKKISRVGSLYGAKHVSTAGRSAETLIPEAVSRTVGNQDLFITRFEITRAQFAAFDKNYKFDPGAENFPANFISFDQARAYAAWLSKLTGDTWRLARESEVAPLYAPRDGENTLDFWAGYTVNPDDAARLAPKIAELGPPGSLLKEVGRFRPAGEEDEELLFDLGGNVTEWVLAADGSPKTLGASADRPSDPKALPAAASPITPVPATSSSAATPPTATSPAANSSPAYTGFRLLRETKK